MYGRKPKSDLRVASLDSRSGDRWTIFCIYPKVSRCSPKTTGPESAKLGATVPVYLIGITDERVGGLCWRSGGRRRGAFGSLVPSTQVVPAYPQGADRSDCVQ